MLNATKYGASKRVLESSDIGDSSRSMAASTR
jgi:hypothetical protein